MQDLQKLHKNFSSGAIIWGSLHPTEENILLLRNINIYNHTPVGADGSNREAIRQGGLWKFLTVRQTYPLSNQR